MSCMESKTVLRAEILELQGADYSKAYSYFKPILGEASMIDEDENEVDYFEYSGEFQPVRGSKARWGIDLILHHSSDYKTYVESEYSKGMTLDDFKFLIDKLGEKFNIDKSKVKFISYDWYNGGDEPIHF